MKKIISILLCAIIISGCIPFVTVSATTLMSVEEALKQYEDETGEKAETYRYYFLMPNGENGIIGEDGYADSWFNEHTDSAGVYWWDSGVADPLSWPGYSMSKADADCVFYADVPIDATTIIFNNAFDGGMDPEQPIYYLQMQTVNIPSEYYDPGESINYPNGTDSFDNMIYVIEPDRFPYGDLSSRVAMNGEWYYYYGNGCYGFTKGGNSDNCLRDDHNHGPKTICREEFLDFAGITEDDDFHYTGPLYYHYDEKGDKKWFLAKGECGTYEYSTIYGVFGDYILFQNRTYSDLRYPYVIYSYDDQQFYTFEDAWDKNIEGLSEAFTEYLAPMQEGRIIGDADVDGMLTVMDATRIQRFLVKTSYLADLIHGECYYGKEIKYSTDINRDGERNILDATAIQQKLAGLS